MPQSKILVDTNSYLRLAKTINPLLGIPFCKDESCLYILSELNEELKPRRFTTKFPWIDEQEYVENREYIPIVGKKLKKQINETYEHIWDYVQTDLPGPSSVDALYLAYALELNIPVVTDDQDMTELAEVFEVTIFSSLKLLKIMFDCQFIKMKIVNGLVEYWRYWDDRPANMEKDYQLFFG